jgi:hypothetical protein
MIHRRHHAPTLRGVRSEWLGQFWRVWGGKFWRAPKFNPRRSAILLIGGEKTGDDRWYEKFVPIADRLFEQHLLELKKEGSI